MSFKRDRGGGFRFKLMTAIGHVIAVTAATLGVAAWTVLVLGFAYARVFVPREKKDPKAVMSPRVAIQVFTVAAVHASRAPRLCLQRSPCLPVTARYGLAWGRHKHDVLRGVRRRIRFGTLSRPCKPEVKSAPLRV